MLMRVIRRAKHRRARRLHFKIE